MPVRGMRHFSNCPTARDQIVDGWFRQLRVRRQLITKPFDPLLSSSGSFGPSFKQSSKKPAIKEMSHCNRIDSVIVLECPYNQLHQIVVYNCDTCLCLREMNVRWGDDSAFRKLLAIFSLETNIKRVLL